MKNYFQNIFYNFFVPFLTVVFCCLILALSIRGLPGNPTATELNQTKWRENGPFELSPERGRYALTYSLVQDGSIYFSDQIEKFAEPDVAYNTTVRKVVSLFAPGISYIIMPGFFIGRYFGLAQVGSVAIIALFAIINVLLIRAIAMRLGAGSIPATLGGLTFLFATPAFAYAVTIYQHHISTFLILMSIYTLMRWKNIWSLSIVWFLFAASLPIDNPNLFFFIPIVIYATGRFFSVEKIRDTYKINFKYIGLITLVTMIIPVALFLWFNAASNSSPFKLSGSMKTVTDIRKETNLLSDNADKSSTTTNAQIRQKNVLGFFQTRNLLNGFYIHTISPDRGTLMFTPVMFFAFIGAFMMLRSTRLSQDKKILEDRTYVSLLIAVAGMIFLLYSMWGDPYGGWAFGSRYMIPAYALGSIFIALLLQYWRNKLIFLAIFFVVLVYSTSVSTLGAITTSRIPPQVEVLGLEKVTHQVEYYNYQRDIQMLQRNQAKSFVFEAFAHNSITAWQYYSIVVGILLLAFMLGMSLLNNKNELYVHNKLRRKI